MDMTKDEDRGRAVVRDRDRGRVIIWRVVTCHPLQIEGIQGKPYTWHLTA